VLTIVFATVNMIILMTFPTFLTCVPEEQIQETQVGAFEPAREDFKLIFMFLFIYHILEAIGHIMELVQIVDQRFMPWLNLLPSLNGCYGLGVYIYLHIKYLGSIFQCHASKDNQIVPFWLVIEIGVFYLQFLISVVVIAMWFRHTPATTSMFRQTVEERFMGSPLLKTEKLLQ